MTRYLGLSIHLLKPESHGRGDGGAPEWPPSPLRAFQCLVAAAAAEQRAVPADAQAALRWLEAQNAPVIVAPAVIGPSIESGYRLSVPNNSMDIVARAWARGSTATTGDANPATHRTMKRVRATYLRTADPIHYLWKQLGEQLAEARKHVPVLQRIARKIVALGWGIDHAVGSARMLTEDESGRLSGERWLPGEVADAGGLRVPLPETLAELMQRHSRFIARVGSAGVLTPPPPLSVFGVIEYRRSDDPPTSSFAGFALLKPEGQGFAAFDAARCGLTVAGMLRHATRRAASVSGWTAAKVDEFVLGHAEQRGSEHEAVGARRFSYLPLPSLEFRGPGRGTAVGGIRRVMVGCFTPAGRSEVVWARRALVATDLLRVGSPHPVAVLAPLEDGDRMLRHYLGPASEWATVTPVVLPGHDDRGGLRKRIRKGVSSTDQRRLLEKLARRTDALLRRALLHAGVPSTLVGAAVIDSRAVGFWPGTDLASRYGAPVHLGQLPRLHVRIGWRDAEGRPIRLHGPLAFGGGRHYGLGLFAALPQD